MSKQSTGKAPTAKPSRAIARRMAAGFSLISIVAIVMCGMLISLIGDISALVDEMSDDDDAGRDALDRIGYGSVSVSATERAIASIRNVVVRKLNDSSRHHVEKRAKVQIIQTTASMEALAVHTRCVLA